jgi:hypothetical protein
MVTLSATSPRQPPGQRHAEYLYANLIGMARGK